LNEVQEGEVARVIALVKPAENDVGFLRRVLSDVKENRKRQIIYNSLGLKVLEVSWGALRQTSPSYPHNAVEINRREVNFEFDQDKLLQNCALQIYIVLTQFAYDLPRSESLLHLIFKTYSNQ